LARKIHIPPHYHQQNLLRHHYPECFDTYCSAGATVVLSQVLQAPVFHVRRKINFLTTDNKNFIWVDMLLLNKYKNNLSPLCSIKLGF